MLLPLLLAWLAPGLPSTPHPGSSPHPSLPVCRSGDNAERVAFRRLRSMTVKARRGDPNLKLTHLQKLPLLLEQTRQLRRSEPKFESEINLALFEMAALVWGKKPPKTDKHAAILAKMSDLAQKELERYLLENGEPTYAWIAQSILSQQRGPEAARIVAARLLRGKRVRSTRQALMYTARTSSLELREYAIEALVGWDDPVVSHFFLESLSKEGSGINDLARHFSSFNRQLEPRTKKPLAKLCASLYRSSAWRDAARARHLVRCLDPKTAIPILLEALILWKHRMYSAGSSKRILWEICHDLRGLSGNAYGPEPDLWQSWWQSVQAGSKKLPDEITAGGAEISTAGFYGLRPITDSVLFLIDRSGSMNDPIGTDHGARYNEAVQQFVDYLRASGSQASFSLVLFSNDTRVYASSATSATRHNIEDARLWMLANGPEGGTFLHHGVARALKLEPNGKIVPKVVEADTVIVLCDGATDEGPNWVAPWLKRWNDEAQIVFQCVEIGRQGDGTLQALAENSGGDYVRVLR